MKKIGFIGCFDKTDLIIYIAKILVATGKKVVVIDSTVNQKAKYVVPVIKPSTTYITEFEGIEVAVGFENYNDLKSYLGIEPSNELDYDIALLDIDSYSTLQSFEILAADKNYFVTGFDTYSLKKGLEILSGVTSSINLTKVVFSKTASKGEDDYLNFLSLGYKVVWDEEIIYFPLEVGDQSVIAENQRVAKIKYKKLSSQYKEGLMYIAEQLIEQDDYATMKRVFKQLEKNV